MAVSTTDKLGNSERCKMTKLKVIQTAVVISVLSFVYLLHQYSVLDRVNLNYFNNQKKMTSFLIFDTYKLNNSHIYNKTQTQKVVFDLFFNLSEQNETRLYIIDPDVISLNTFHNNSRNHTMGDRNMITLGMNGTVDTKVNVFDYLKDKGFNVYYSAIYTYSIGANTTLPAHFLIYHKDTEFLFHVVVFYKRHKHFIWCDKLQKEKLIKKIKDDNLNDSTERITKLLDNLHFGRKAFSFKSIITTMGNSENINILIPENGKQFLKDYQELEFLECNYTRADLYYKNYKISKKPTSWILKAVRMLEKIGEAMDKIGVPFTIAEGTLLGWYRQCGIMSYTTDLDVLILREDYNDNILKSFKNIGFSHIQTFGKLNDSFEYSFRWSGVKLDVFFAYKENDQWWIGGTNGRNKLRFTIPKFKNCWSELMGVRVRVPCNAGEYIKKSYGKNWYKPIKKWNWAGDASNFKVVGRWKRSIAWIKRHAPYVDFLVTKILTVM